MRRASMRPKARSLALLLAGALPVDAVAQGSAAASDRRWIHFELDYPAAPGDFLHVLGDPAELGGNDMTRALRMGSVDRLHWSAWVDLARGIDFTYSYVVRDGNAKKQSDPANGALVAGPFPGPREARADPKPRALEVLSTAEHPWLHLRGREGSGRFARAPLTRVGAGRTPGESRFALETESLPATIEFFVGSAEGRQLSPPPGSFFRSSFPELWVQDDEVFAYPPAAHVSAPRLVGPFLIHSTALAEDRSFSIRLPRGYDEHRERRYPVLILMETDIWWGSCGQIAGPNGPYYRFDCDGETLADLVRRGVVDEFLTVAIDVTINPCPRQRLLTPPEDWVRTASGCTGFGFADLTTRFVADELLPWVAAAYRTRPEPRQTFVAGFSMSAVFALYAAWERPDVFGGCGALSGAWALAPNWLAREQSEAAPTGLRVYADAGDQEGSAPVLPLYIYKNTLALASELMTKPRPLVVGEGLSFRVIFGASHGPYRPQERLEAMLERFAPGGGDAR